MNDGFLNVPIQLRMTARVLTQPRRLRRLTLGVSSTAKAKGCKEPH